MSLLNCRMQYWANLKCHDWIQDRISRPWNWLWGLQYPSDMSVAQILWWNMGKSLKLCIKIIRSNALFRNVCSNVLCLETLLSSEDLPPGLYHLCSAASSHLCPGYELAADYMLPGHHNKQSREQCMNIGSAGHRYRWQPGKLWRNLRDAAGY